jgi:hypothetical protein
MWWPDMNIVTSLGPVSHNGITYKEGEEIPDLSSLQENHLLSAGVIESVQPSKKIKDDNSK